MHTELETWSPAIRVITRPWAAERPMPHIRTLRVITLAVVGVLAAMGIVLLFTVDLGGSYPSGWLYGWLGVTALAFSLNFYSRTNRNEHFVRSANERHALGLYQSRMLLGLALAEIPALAGLFISYATDSIIPYLLGLVVSLVKMYQAGPTKADIVGLQTWLDEFKDPFDLASVLMQKPEVDANA
jgi:hypothetical protein